ncbi:type VII secretion protein EccB [Mycobacteroides abscessus]|uniref:type VII secretion protein EccB n=1 Tax=Mycobacteroides abscessus TaxID=36809 RepID=UPI0009A8E32D|nr:type VII secretion protein EccB [Mycobacteroides abscessus]SKO16128.1 ESX-5 type VII secretion system protein EccB5,probable membrane protein [Mycobacteroides abscessus subsp. bolletii]SKX37064.1 ESX-5 type VII secretion system protein EccB5,probable membrane protein [Mycobacteroides abscessus subsp. bolletii]
MTSPDQKPGPQGRGLRYVTREMVSGARFLAYRNSEAVAVHEVHLLHHPRKARSASMLVGAVGATVVIAGSLLLSFFKPAGQIDEQSIVADRASGAKYVKVDGVMHPVLNLTSARLIAGQDRDPKFVPGNEIRKFPIGDQVGIIGAPDDLTPRTPVSTAWGLCDRLGSTGAKVIPRTTVLDGLPELGDWSTEVAGSKAVLMSYAGQVFVVSQGHRSLIDLADRPVTLALGLQVGELKPVPMSRALYNALPPTPPLRMPSIETPGAAVAYAAKDEPLVSGQVLRTKDAQDKQVFFVVLPAGVQQIPLTVATMLGNAGVSSGRPVEMAFSRIAQMPLTHAFDTSIFPEEQLQLEDKTANPVTCMYWRKDATDPRARIMTLSGRRLPIPIENEPRVRPLGNGDGSVADQVYITADGANFVQVTGNEAASGRAESLWFITDSGIRWGVLTHGEPTEGNKDGGGDIEKGTRKALGLSGPATQAPWAIVQWLPPSRVPLSKSAALQGHMTFEPDRSSPMAPPKEGQ